MHMHIHTLTFAATIHVQIGHRCCRGTIAPNLPSSTVIGRRPPFTVRRYTYIYIATVLASAQHSHINPPHNGYAVSTLAVCPESVHCNQKNGISTSVRHGERNPEIFSLSILKCFSINGHRAIDIISYACMNVLLRICLRFHMLNFGAPYTYGLLASHLACPMLSRKTSKQAVQLTQPSMDTDAWIEKRT